MNYLGELTRAIIFGDKKQKPKKPQKNLEEKTVRKIPTNNYFKQLFDDIKLLMKQNKKMYTEFATLTNARKYDEPNNKEILENIENNNNSRSTKEFLTKAIYRQINNKEGKVIPISTDKTNSPVILALSKAKITPKDVLNINKWLSVFEHNSEEKETILSLQNAAEEIFIKKKNQEVEEGKEAGIEEGYETGKDSAPGQRFNKKGRDEIKNNLEMFAKFREDFTEYLLNPEVSKSNAKKYWGKWVYKEHFKKSRVSEKDPHWKEFKENVLLVKEDTDVEKLISEGGALRISPTQQLVITDDDETIVEKETT